MANQHNVLFLYKKGIVPALILKQAKQTLPAHLELTLCDDTETPEARRAKIVDADYVMLYGTAFADIDVAANVKLLQLLSAGYDRLDLAALAAAGIPLADNGGANAQTVAEHTLLLMLAVLKRLPLHHNATAAGEWLGMREGLHLRELCDKQVGIVGFGRIGRLVARMVEGFSARAVFHDAVEVAPEAGAHARRLPLDELLRTSDIITLHTPLTDQSRGLVGAAELASMLPHAVLINTSRGGIVDEVALVEALQEGRLGGAGLDVFEAEPLAAPGPLSEMPNVVLTPHVAGTTLDTWSRRLQFAFANIERVARGETAQSLVGDKPR